MRWGREAVEAQGLRKRQGSFLGSNIAAARVALGAQRETKNKSRISRKRPERGPSRVSPHPPSYFKSLLPAGATFPRSSPKTRR